MSSTDDPHPLDAYDFDLPEARIAQRPSERREDARLLVLDRNDGGILAGAETSTVATLPEWLDPGDLLVVNTTRVLSARLRGTRETGGRVEALILGPLASSPAAQAAEVGARRYRALLKLRGRQRPGLQLSFERADGAGEPPLRAEVVALGERGAVVLEFADDRSPYAFGEAPLPPYIKRAGAGASDALSPAEDLERYQTVFARVPGAIAAPTAGLHLSQALLEALDARGVERAEVVLHVGAGTFRPLTDAQLAEGRLHEERFVLPRATVEAIEATRARGGRVVAVGTTTTRVLEACALDGGRLEAAEGHTDLFIRPGHRFQVVDALLTNFHLPRSSLLLLVSAFVGREPLLRAYARAIERGFRFYSYGDAMLIIAR